MEKSQNVRVQEKQSNNKISVRSIIQMALS